MTYQQKSAEQESLMQELYTACKLAEENLYVASEQMQNRGLKVLFQRFAQQLRQYGTELQQIATQMHITLSTPGRYRNTLQRGWFDIRTGMIVGRANRQLAAAEQGLETNHKLLTQYNEVLRDNTSDGVLPEFAKITLEKQQTTLQRINRWLERIATKEEWIVRLYEDETQANQAIAELRNSGFADSQIKIDPLGDLPLYQKDDEERAHSAVDAVLTGAIFGALIGVVIGLIAGYLIPVFTWETPTNAFIISFMIRSGLIGMAVVASFFSFFGFLLGRGIAEDDASLTRSFAGEDVVVVSVQTTAANHTNAAKILHMWHERQVEHVPA
ncbi:MAG: hypothetical protein KDE47_34990 [Caldilineaceae bacterium]|nr:hypothetical protein [Caldilineaceae bacterium]